MATRLLRIADIATFTTPAKTGKSGELLTPSKRNIGKLPVSPATIWRWVRQGQFPQPFKLSQSVTVWNATEVDAFVARRAGSVE